MPKITITVSPEHLEKIKDLMVVMNVTEIEEFFARATVLIEGTIAEHQKGRKVVSFDEEVDRWYPFFPDWLAKIPRFSLDNTRWIVKEFLMSYPYEGNK